MNNKKSRKNSNDNTIALNRKARHNYNLEQSFEAGIVLEGWEVKSIRLGKVNIADSHVILKGSDAWLLNILITPLHSTSTHVFANATRTRKLLLHRKELDQLRGCVERSGYTLIPTVMYWKKNLVKLSISLAKGKKFYDKRASSKDQDWQRERQRIFKKSFIPKS